MPRSCEGRPAAIVVRSLCEKPSEAPGHGGKQSVLNNDFLPVPRARSLPTISKFTSRIRNLNCPETAGDVQQLWNEGHGERCDGGVAR